MTSKTISNPDPKPVNDDLVSLVNLLLTLKDRFILQGMYRNWKGSVRLRNIKPLKIWYGATQYHPEPGLMLTAIDVDNDAERDFALKDFDMASMKLL